MDTVERNKTSDISSSSFRTLEGFDCFTEFRLFQQQLAEEKFAQGHRQDVCGLSNGVGAINICGSTEHRRKKEFWGKVRDSILNTILRSPYYHLVAMNGSKIQGGSESQITDWTNIN